MKIVNKNPEKTADISSARGSSTKEFWKMIFAAAVLLIVLYFLIGLSVDFIVPRISFETEAKIFKHHGLPKTKEENQEKLKNFEKACAILEALKTGKNVPPLPYRLALIEYEDPNAFAFPGGSIGISTGLLDVLKDEIEIAFVIGHELGHFHNRDHLRGLGRAVGFGIIMATVFGSGSGAESFGNIINMVLQRNYSQDREKMADRFGIELVYSIYGRVNGTDHLFKILHEHSKVPVWAYMFSTHPSPEERIKDLEKYSRELTGSREGRGNPLIKTKKGVSSWTWI